MGRSLTGPCLVLELFSLDQEFDTNFISKVPSSVWLPTISRSILLNLGPTYTEFGKAKKAVLSRVHSMMEETLPIKRTLS